MNDTAITPITSSEIAQTRKFDPDQIALLKSQIAPRCTDDELNLFVQVCQNTGLDPFSRQIYANRRKSKGKNGQWEERMVIQIGIDGLRLIAHRSGQYVGNETFWCGTDGQWRDIWLENYPPAAAKCHVWKRGCDRPFVGVARFSAYSQNQATWKSMPDVMIGKCAEAQALRKAFPAELARVRATDEDGNGYIPPTPRNDSEQRFYERFIDALSRVDNLEKLKELQQWAHAQIDRNPHAIAPSSRKFIDQQIERVKLNILTVDAESEEF